MPLEIVIEIFLREPSLQREVLIFIMYNVNKKLWKEHDKNIKKPYENSRKLES